uniref:Uncharacterized protein n=1 Tax=Cacopsylla melanoneura TaxID=428564 RepID=A0A8D8XJR6_9HEMI
MRWVWHRWVSHPPQLLRLDRVYCSILARYQLPHSLTLPLVILILIPQVTTLVVNIPPVITRTVIIPLNPTIIILNLLLLPRKSLSILPKRYQFTFHNPTR